MDWVKIASEIIIPVIGLVLSGYISLGSGDSADNYEEVPA